MKSMADYALELTGVARKINFKILGGKSVV